MDRIDFMFLYILFIILYFSFVYKTIEIVYSKLIRSNHFNLI